jgi:MFS family permease
LGGAFAGTVGSAHLSEEETPETGGLIAALWHRPAIVLFALVMALYSLVYVQNAFSLPVQLQQALGTAGPQLYGTIMSLNGVTVVLCTTGVVYWARRRTPTLNIAWGGLLYAVGFGLVYFSRSAPLYLLSALIWTMGEVVVTTSFGPYISNNSPSSHRGRFSSAVDVIQGAGLALGPLLAGTFIDGHGVRAVWPVVAGIAVVASGLMWLLSLAEQRRALARQAEELAS